MLSLFRGMGVAEICSLDRELFAWVTFLCSPLAFLSFDNVLYIIKIEVSVAIGVKPSQQWRINKWASNALDTSEGVTERKRIVEPQP